jgi:putative ABC transport system permease protein
MHAQDRRVQEAKGAVALSTPADLIDEDRKITAVLLRLISRDASDTPANLPQVFDQLRRDGTLTVASPSQEIRNLFEIVDQVNRVFLAIAIIVLLSSAISIMLALYNSMEQRRRQIAVLRVLGASQGRIFNLTLVECALIGLGGAIAGIVFAYVGAAMASGVLRQRFGLIIEPAISPTIILVLLALTTVLAMIAGLVPAVMAYRTSVAKNLRPIA